MSQTASSNTSVLLAVEDTISSNNSNVRTTRLANIAPREPVEPATQQAAEDGDGNGDQDSDTEYTTNTNDPSNSTSSKRKRPDALEPGSLEWERNRKNSHKEVERRRREVINQGIERLALLIPGVEKNKGRIIAQAVDYIHRLKTTEEKNIEKWTIEKLLADQAISELTTQVEALKEENKRLRREKKQQQQQQHEEPVPAAVAVAVVVEEQNEEDAAAIEEASGLSASPPSPPPVAVSNSPRKSKSGGRKKKN